jgi:hypothetical protein
MMHGHLSGRVFYGSIPLRPGNTARYVCLDVDGINGLKYEFDYKAEMKKVVASGLPLVVFRTKSGGLRVVLFFSEEVDAAKVVAAIKRIGAKLGYASDVEVFPKQVEILDDGPAGDFPNWIFLPFGPRDGKFPDQCAMNERGDPQDMLDALEYAKKQRITEAQLEELTGTLPKKETKSGGKAKGKGKARSKGKWKAILDENGGTDYHATLAETFEEGPFCQLALTQINVPTFQHNFLFNCTLFLKKKYPDNWPEALEWVNYHVLRPAGDTQRLKDTIRDMKNREYHYRCGDEPIVSVCNGRACRMMRYGVGSDERVDNVYHLTIIEREPELYYYVYAGDKRFQISYDKIYSLRAFRSHCAMVGMPGPPVMKEKEWITFINTLIAEAKREDPNELLRSYNKQLDALERWFGDTIPWLVRTQGQLYKDGKFDGGIGNIRIKEKEKRVFFKLEPLRLHLRRVELYNDAQWDEMVQFLNFKATRLGKSGRGAKGWFRFTMSLPFDIFKPHIVDGWLKGDMNKAGWEEEPEDGDAANQAA